MSCDARVAAEPATGYKAARPARIGESPAVDRHPADRGRARTTYRLRRTVAHALLGFAFGYVILHPITMFVFDWMGVYPEGEPLVLCLDWLSRAFAPEMVPMGLIFGVLSMSLAGVDGFYRSLVHIQRDDLAHQLNLNERQRQRLEGQYSTLRELQLSKQRTARFLVHDLKNHVGCVLGYARRLLARADGSGWPPADVESLETVLRQATRMAGALKDILELARLEGSSRMEFAPTPAKGILRRSVAEAALGPGEGPVHIDDDGPEDLVIMCDSMIIERVLANLMLNAFKHNGQDVCVSLGVSRKGHEAHFSCRDTGSGIPAAVRHLLFEEFASGGRRDDETPSYGLGLSFCRTAVEAHEGRIWLDSAEGEGTTIFFSVPIWEGQGQKT